ncbi:hypothetical protein Fcan01_12846 [Folsomia candida]|uniref:Uncharacterized protein n=1 Tax=Folsomia candida TaxID=158441 RepID=A0A226E6R4_FOLCA|nr:hypothetical protein Fcan01_12846 [Folsomia candida]
MSNPQDPLAVLRNRLLTRYNQLLSEHTFTWSQILENTTRCAKLIEEQVEVNHKFTDFNNMYMEINLSWPTELQTYPCFVDMMDQVKQLSEWMSEFEPQSNQALNKLKEMAISVKLKLDNLTNFLPTIQNSNDFSQLQDINLTDFQWVDASEWPNVGLLEDEWGSKRMLNLINLCVLQMTQLFSTPVGVLLSELEFMYEDSSSSPEETEGGELFLN